MYANNKMILQLISLLKQFGIRKVVVSPGSRHIPLVYSMENDDYFQLYTVVDERSAGFFAIGLIQESGEPVACACTSGTSCINYGSALIEAFYQHLPLLLLSADRLTQLLGQNEEQTYAQVSTYRECTKYCVKLPIVQSDIDAWYCNRLINEALIELNHHGRGPVHIDYPMADHFSIDYNVAELPCVRKILLNKSTMKEFVWKELADSLSKKKVAILCGQSVIWNEDSIKSLICFSKSFDAIVLTDNISNCHGDFVVNNTSILLESMSNEQKSALLPDVLITIGGH